MLPAVRAQTTAAWAVAAALAGCGGPEATKAGGQAGARATALPVPAPSESRPPLIADVVCTSGAGRCRLANGPVRLKKRAYSDVDFTIIAANDELLGATLIQTAYFDQLSTLDPLLKFTLLRRARVYVAGMFSSPLPAWLEGWRLEFLNKWPNGLQLMVDPKGPDVAALTVYSKDMDPGPIAFGPPQSAPDMQDRTVMMYLVVVSEEVAQQ
jgi:hypothetical protein